MALPGFVLKISFDCSQLKSVAASSLSRTRSVFDLRNELELHYCLVCKCYNVYKREATFVNI